MITWSHFFIVPEKFTKKTFPNLVLHRITINEYTLENITPIILSTKAGEAEQTADPFSEQTRSCAVEV